MSQGPDWNTPGGYQAPPPQYAQPTPPPQYAQPTPPPQYGQPYPGAGMAPYVAAAPMAAAVPPGFYFDQNSGLVLPNGTMLAPVGRRIGAYFLAILLSFVTLGIGYMIWGLISWGKGQTPVQQVLGLQCWKPVEKVNATWGTMFLRGLAYVFVGIIPFAQLVSFFVFVTGKEHRTLHDSISSVVVLHDPNKVLKPVYAQ